MLVMQQSSKFLKENNIGSNETAVGILLYERQYLRKDNVIEIKEPILRLMTSRELLYCLLKHCFSNECILMQEK
jgi:hypothetical protein